MKTIVQIDGLLGRVVEEQPTGAATGVATWSRIAEAMKAAGYVRPDETVHHLVVTDEGVVFFVSAPRRRKGAKK